MPTRTSRAPGMTAVATEAGLSIATVSRALKRPEMVRPDTVKKVKAAAAKLGYLTGGDGQTQHRLRTGMVAIILPTIENSIFSEMVGALTQTLIGLDRTLVVATHNYNKDEEVRILRSMIERRVEGVILVGGDHHEAVHNLVESTRIPMIEAWNYRPQSNVATVGVDNMQAGFLIADYCVSQGHSRIAIVFHDNENNDRASLRRQGVLKALDAHDIKLNPSHDHVCSYDIATAKQLALRVLTRPGPTVYLCGNDVIALGFLFAARSLGIRVPQDVSIVGIGDFSFAKSTEPSLTTVRIPAKTIGRELAELVTRMIERPVVEDIPSVQIQPKMIERNSCARLR